MPGAPRQRFDASAQPVVPVSLVARSDGGYDVVIVGGGITGAGIARDAALRGLRVALFDKGDYGSGTSSKSSKLIHGGLRYLGQGEVRLVFESLSERAVQCRVAPHLVLPIRFLVPMYEQSRPGLEVVNIGLWLYDTLALFRTPKLHRTYRGERAVELIPQLDRDGLRGAIEYSDCITDDARLVLENILDARSLGAHCHSYTEVIRLKRNRKSRVEAVVVRDRLNGKETTYRTRAVIVAAGPWTDEFARAVGLGIERPILRRTKGVHLVFPRDKLPIERAITLISPRDGRVMFAIPWRGRLVIGTTDTDFDGSADEVYADPEDARYLCESANSYFPSARFRLEEAIASWAGLRPLINEEGETESDVSREHEIFARDDGVTIIAGGKLTTYRRMAKQVVTACVNWLRDNDDTFDKQVQPPRTKKRPLPGAAGLAEASSEGVRRLAGELAAKHALDSATAEHLAQVYGARAEKVVALVEQHQPLGDRIEPNQPHLWAEVVFAASDDLARTVDDVLGRRLPLLLTSDNQGLDVVDRVGSMLAEKLGWSAAERERQIAAYRDTVASSRRFKS